MIQITLLKNKEMDKYTDQTIMPFGKYKGKTLEEVSASWLIWYQEEATDEKDQKLLDYIQENKMVLLQEADLSKNKNGRY